MLLRAAVRQHSLRLRDVRGAAQVPPPLAAMHAMFFPVMLRAPLVAEIWK